MVLMIDGASLYIAGDVKDRGINLSGHGVVQHTTPTITSPGDGNYVSRVSLSSMDGLQQQDLSIDNA